MFVLEPSLVQLAASPDDVLTLLTSLNKPMVALEDHPMDEGDATIWSVRRESDMVSTYVHLCLTNKKIGVFYRYEVDPYPDDLRGMVEAEALGFTESLGFIMDNTHYAELDAEERKQHLVRSPFEWSGLEVEGEDAAGPGRAGGPPDSETVDFGEAGQDVVSEAGSDAGQAFLSDEEVDGAVRALTGAEPAGLEGPGGGGADDAFERAVEEFIAGETGPAGAEERPGADAAPAPPVPETDAPGPLAPADAGASPSGRSGLSRFQRRKPDGDIYQIRGLGQPAVAVDAPQEPVAPPTPEELPPARTADAEGAGRSAETEAPAADVVPADPETRRRRARARFLASF